MGGGPFMALFGLLFFLLFVALVAWVIVMLVRGRRHWHMAAARESMPAAPASEDALEILRQRYARGEITREQYLAMREDLAR